MQISRLTPYRKIIKTQNISQGDSTRLWRGCLFNRLSEDDSDIDPDRVHEVRIRLDSDLQDILHIRIFNIHDVGVLQHLPNLIDSDVWHIQGNTVDVALGVVDQINYALKNKGRRKGIHL
jgi:hypothetical protein